MKLIFSLFAASYLLVPVIAAGQDSKALPRGMSRWTEITPPLPERNASRGLFEPDPWDDSDWHVYRNKSGEPCAKPWSSSRTSSGPLPPFIPRATLISSGTSLALELEKSDSCCRTDDGWLVGFNRGEFGAVLYWFNEDGSKHYKISDHQVVSFVKSGGEIFAIEGLAHTQDEGSVIRIETPAKTGRWVASTVVKLPSAPYAVAARRDGTLIIILDGSIMTVSRDGKLESAMQSDHWAGLYPNSSLISVDEAKLYIGMRKVVLEISLGSRTTRYFLPDATLLEGKTE